MITYSHTAVHTSLLKPSAVDFRQNVKWYLNSLQEYVKKEYVNVVKVA